MIVDISCPNCQSGVIKLMPHALLEGAAFICDSCNAKVSLAPASKACLEQTISKYETYSKRLENLKSEGNSPRL